MCLKRINNKGYNILIITISSAATLILDYVSLSLSQCSCSQQYLHSHTRWKDFNKFYFCSICAFLNDVSTIIL